MQYRKIYLYVHSKRLEDEIFHKKHLLRLVIVRLIASTLQLRRYTPSNTLLEGWFFTFFLILQETSQRHDTRNSVLPQEIIEIEKACNHQCLLNIPCRSVAHRD